MLTRNLTNCLVELYKELNLKASANYLIQTKNKELDLKDEKLSLTSVYEKHEWAIVLENIEKKLEDEEQRNKTDISENSHRIKDPEQEISEYGARASFHLKKWSHLGKFTEEMENGVQKEFYNSILNIKDRNFSKAKQTIRKCRKLLVKDFGSFGDYMGSYDKIMKMHQIRELEEILIAMKEQDEINNSVLYDFILGK